MQAKLRIEKVVVNSLDITELPKGFIKDHTIDEKGDLIDIVLSDQKHEEDFMLAFSEVFGPESITCAGNAQFLIKKQIKFKSPCYFEGSEKLVLVKQ